ncbi:hypothetical protein HaLaN_09676, partial [Haematococcus lacustris]
MVTVAMAASSVSFELSLGVGVSLVSFSQSLQLLSDQISYTLGRPPPPPLPFEERQLAIQLSIGFTASISESADVNLDATLEGLQQQIQAALGPLAARRQALQLLTGGGGSGSSEGEPQG